jgi:hypothetical protein
VKPSGFKAPTRDEAVAAAQTLSTHLAAGRKAVKAKDYATGIRELSAARDLGPMNAKVLGELGWAYFLDGKLDEAAHELEQALHYAAKNQTKGAVLYNLGRVAEKQGDKERAAEFYTQSLRARPNATVQTRLEALGTSGEGSHALCGFADDPSKPDGMSCAGYLARNFKDFDDPPVCSYEDRRLVEVTQGDLHARVFAVHDYDLMEEHFVLAVRTADGVWRTSEFVTVFHPGVGYADESVDDVTLEAQELTGKGPPELVLRWRIGQHDMDPGIMYQEDSTHSNLAVISADEGRPAWMATVRTETEWNSGEMDPDEWGAMVDPKTGKTKASVRFDNKGGLTVSLDGKTPPVSTTAGSFQLGAYPVLCPAEQDYFGL